MRQKNPVYPKDASRLILFWLFPIIAKQRELPAKRLDVTNKAQPSPSDDRFP